MGTHPIFESDFDCLTERKKRNRQKNVVKYEAEGQCASNHAATVFLAGDDVAGALYHKEKLHLECSRRGKTANYNCKQVLTCERTKEASYFSAAHIFSRKGMKGMKPSSSS